MSQYPHSSPKRRAALCCAFVLLTALLITSLSGCEAAGEDGVRPIPQMPVDLTPTDELVIYIPGFNFMIADINPAIDLYRQKYPDVNVIVEITEEDINVWPYTYTQRVNTELMAGGGPDVIIAYRDFIPDIYKALDTGAFLDLSLIMDEDEEFHTEDYYQPILDAGLYKGGRYLVPYCFNLPLISTLPQEVTAAEFDLSKSTDAVSFFNELAKCLTKLEENPRYKNAISEIPYIFAGLYYADIELIDYEHRKVLPDEAALKAFCEAYKPYAKTDYPVKSDIINWSNRNTYEQLKAGNSLFALSYSASGIPYNMREAKAYGDSALLFAIPSIDGGLNAYMESGLAIRAASKNQLNAWNFIKIMLLEDIQQGKNMNGTGAGTYLVNKKALRNVVNYYNEQNSINNPNGNEISEQPLTQEELQQFYDLLDGITGCAITNDTVFNYFFDIMRPYFFDEKSYEECVAELKLKLQLYLDE